MKLINQSAEIWQQPEGEVGIYKQVEKAARLCYKSEDKVTEDSYKRFIDMLNSNGHLSPLEHGTIYLAFHEPWDARSYWEVEKYILNSYSRVSKSIYDKKDYREGERQYSTAYVTTNYRVLKEHGWEKDLLYLYNPTEYHTERISVHITTSRSISHELVRHRVFSFCQESQRYCAYNKGKFGGEVTFIKPTWSNLPVGEYKVEGGYPEGHDECPAIERKFINSLMDAEHFYLTLLQEGWKPQQAREVLPNATKTELIMTGYEDDWEEFFKLRCSPAAHPMMQELANQIKELIHGTKD